MYSRQKGSVLEVWRNILTGSFLLWGAHATALSPMGAHSSPLAPHPKGQWPAEKASYESHANPRKGQSELTDSVKNS